MIPFIGKLKFNEIKKQLNTLKFNMSLHDLNNLCLGEFTLYEALVLTKLEETSKYIDEIADTVYQVEVKQGNFTLDPFSIMFVNGQVQLTSDQRLSQPISTLNNIITLDESFKCFSRSKVIVLRNYNYMLNFIHFPDNKLWGWMHIVSCINKHKTEEYTKSLIKFLGTKEDIQRVTETIKRQIS